jgi:hypothetical protein
MTSDVVVHKDERGIELRRSPFIGNDLDAEPAIPALSSSMIACSEPAAAIVLRTSLTVMASNPLEHSPVARGSAAATPVDPMASPSTMAEMAPRFCAQHFLHVRCFGPGVILLPADAAFLRRHPHA